MYSEDPLLRETAVGSLWAYYDDRRKLYCQMNWMYMKECMLMGYRDGGWMSRKVSSFSKEWFRIFCGPLGQRIKGEGHVW